VKRWHLCGRGLRLLASAEHIHIRNFAIWPENTAVMETANMVQRGEAGILQHMWHNADIYGFFAQLTLAARREAGQAFCWWETGSSCERRYRVHEQWYNLRPDGPGFLSWDWAEVQLLAKLGGWEPHTRQIHAATGTEPLARYVGHASRAFLV